MAITCKKILELPYANQLKVLAGKSNLNNEIKWVHYLEEIEYAKWLKGGELIIISGLMTAEDTKSLIRLLEKLGEMRVAGVVINLSSYITKIPEEVLSYSESIGLPIFEMPANIRIIDISQSICYAIFEERKQLSEISDIMEDILHGSRISEKRLHKCIEYGYDKEKVYCTILFKIEDKYMMKGNMDSWFYEEYARDDMLMRIALLIKGNYGKEKGIFITRYNEYLVWMIEEEQVERTEKYILPHILKKIVGVGMDISFGSRFTELKQLKNSVNHGIMAIDLNQKSEDGVVYKYKDMLSLRMINLIDDKQELKLIVEDILGELLLEKNNYLLETLECYFSHNCNAKLAAEAMYIHTNTFHYRLHKIETLCNKKLTIEDEKFHLQLAIKILKYTNFCV